MGVRGWRERRTERAIDPFYSNLERRGLLCTAFVLAMYASLYHEQLYLICSGGFTQSGDYYKYKIIKKEY